MGIEYKKLSEFSRGLLFELVTDAYSSIRPYEKYFVSDWLDFDDFNFDHPFIADLYGFVTTLNNEAIGFVFWDPRNLPDYVEIGQNCIASKHKGNGYGKLQLQEAVDRIKQYDVKKIIVTTNEDLVPAQHMYESVGFIEYRRRKNENQNLADYVDYEYLL